MKNSNKYGLCVLVALTVLSSVNHVAAQGTAFMYQGQLNTSGSPANGDYDFKFTLFNNSSTNTGQVGTPITQDDIGVTNGLFTVTLDFGDVFTGAATWLAIGVRTNGGSSFTGLSPLQELTPTPYAIYAGNAGTATSAQAVAAANITGALALAQLPGAVVTNDEGTVTLENVTVSGTLTLAPPATIDSGGNNLFLAPGNNNFYAGPSAGISNGLGGANTGLGGGALQGNTNGTNNTAVGFQTLFNNASGSYNVAMGERALYQNINGVDNTAYGRHALLSNTSGNNNTAYGYEALLSIPTGSNNIALGYQAGNSYGASESSNILIGNLGVGGDYNTIRIGSSQTETYIAGILNGNGNGLTNLSASQLTSGTIPVAQLPTAVLTNNETSVNLGTLNLKGNLDLPAGSPTAGDIFSGGIPLLIQDSFNFFVGPGTGNLTTSGLYNTGSGISALSVNTTGGYNAASGAYALNANTTGNNNTAVGYSALFANTNGGQNTAVGSLALAYSAGGDFNTAIGAYALELDKTGGANTAEGYQALYNNLSGGGNTSIGVNVMYRNTSGSYNTAAGYGALENSTSDSDLVAIGYNALQNDSAVGKGSSSGFGENTAVGYEALMLDTNGYDNTGVGYNALTFNSSGSYNTATGAYALLGDFFAYSVGGGNTADGAMALALNTSGYNNVAIGYNSLPASADNHDNIGIGVDAFQNLENGSANTGLGTYTFQSLVDGDFNIGLGYAAGSDLDSGTNNIYIGNYGASSENNIIRIGQGQTQTYIAGNICLGGAAPQQTLNINGGICVDQSSLNVGNVNNALTFGSGSGEGVGSIRTSGDTDSFGLNFYTDYNKRMTIQQHGNVGIGTADPQTPLDVNGAITCCTITITGGCDLAEPFRFSPAKEEMGEGSVVVIDEANPGHLKLADRPYDTRVAGVISGANGINPGIQMQQKGSLEGDKNVALTGRVYVQADTSNGVIKPGDLLTTSSIPGQAMKVTDHLRGQGAILGKAMTGLNDSKGMVLVLVTLQ